MSLSDFQSGFLPYCLKRVTEGRYAVLNRDYKPLGFLTDKWLRYEDYPVVAEIIEISPAVAAKISHKGATDVDCIYLYDDGCIPTRSSKYMERYLKRLARLAKLEVRRLGPVPFEHEDA